MWKLLASELRSRWEIVANKSNKYDGMHRFFALLEIYCFPISMLTLLLLVVQVVMAACGCQQLIPGIWQKYFSPILLAGAVGYLTNYLAIMMLFRPYYEKRWLVIWPQGMIPRNQASVARAMGDQVGNKLLAPEMIASEIGDKLKSFLDNPELAENIKKQIRNYLQKNRDSILAAGVPKVREVLFGVIGRLITPERLNNFLKTNLVPRLKDEDTRAYIAECIVKFGQENAASLENEIRQQMREHLTQKLHAIPGSQLIIELAMEFFAGPKSIQKHIKDWLGEEQTQLMLQEKMDIVSEKFDQWLLSPAGENKVSSFSEEAKTKLMEFVDTYLAETLERFMDDLLNTDQLWHTFDTKIFPALKDRLVALVYENKQTIIDHLKLSERIETAIKRQDVRDFHQMINNIAAQHLGAIQVLGYVLGIIIGGIQLIQSILIHC